MLPLRTIGQLPLQVEQLIVEVDLHPHVARNRLGPIAGFERKVDSEHADIDAVLNMAPTDQEIEIVPPAEPVEMPLPSDPKVIFLGGLFVLALLATAYVASEIVLPLIFAIILNLLLQPALHILERLHVPRIWKVQFWA